MRQSKVFIAPLVVLLAGMLMTEATALGDPGSRDPSSLRPAVSDKELRAFTRATLEIDQIRLEYERAIADAVKTLADQASAEIHGTFERQQITIGDYGRIGKAVAQDPSLRRKVNRMARDEVEKHEKGPGSAPKAPSSRPAPPQRKAPPSSGGSPPASELTALELR